MDNEIQLRNKYSKIFDNGVAHIESATLLAKSSRYDFAISHIILGIEELIKYQVAYNYFCQCSTFKDDEIKSIFTKHKSKHNLLEEFQTSISEEFSEAFHDYVFKNVTGQELSDKHEEVKNNRFKEIGAFLTVAYKDINLSAEDKKIFSDWLKEANDLKNKGFYVDYYNGNWWFPDTLTETEYLIALKFATAIKKQTEVIKSMDITEDEFMNYLNSDVNSVEFREKLNTNL